MHIFISPHPDDICFSAFLAIYQHKQNGKSVILNIFNQSCWTFKAKPLRKNHKEITDIRRNEEKSFSLYMNSVIEFLEFKDSILRHEFGQEYTIKPNEDPLYKKIKKTLLTSLEKYTPVENIYIPLGISMHLDHLICRDIIYNHIDLREKIIFYEDLPYIAKIDKNKITDFINDFDPRLISFTLSSPNTLPKKSAISLYESQLENNTCSTIIDYGLKLGNNSSFIERYWKIS